MGRFIEIRDAYRPPRSKEEEEEPLAPRGRFVQIRDQRRNLAPEPTPSPIPELRAGLGTGIPIPPQMLPRKKTIPGLDWGGAGQAEAAIQPISDLTWFGLQFSPAGKVASPLAKLGLMGKLAKAPVRSALAGFTGEVSKGLLAEEAPIEEVLPKAGMTAGLFAGLDIVLPPGFAAAKALTPKFARRGISKAVNWLMGWEEAAPQVLLRGTPEQRKLFVDQIKDTDFQAVIDGMPAAPRLTEHFSKLSEEAGVLGKSLDGLELQALERGFTMDVSTAGETVLRDPSKPYMKELSFPKVEDAFSFLETQKVLPEYRPATIPQTADAAARMRRMMVPPEAPVEATELAGTNSLPYDFVKRIARKVDPQANFIEGASGVVEEEALGIERGYFDELINMRVGTSYGSMPPDVVERFGPFSATVPELKMVADPEARAVIMDGMSKKFAEKAAGVQEITPQNVRKVLALTRAEMKEVFDPATAFIEAGETGWFKSTVNFIDRTSSGLLGNTVDFFQQLEDDLGTPLYNELIVPIVEANRLKLIRSAAETKPVAEMFEKTFPKKLLGRSRSNLDLRLSILRLLKGDPRFRAITGKMAGKGVDAAKVEGMLSQEEKAADAFLDKLYQFKAGTKPIAPDMDMLILEEARIPGYEPAWRMAAPSTTMEEATRRALQESVEELFPGVKVNNRFIASLQRTYGGPEKLKPLGAFEKALAYIDMANHAAYVQPMLELKALQLTRAHRSGMITDYAYNRAFDFMKAYQNIPGTFAKSYDSIISFYFAKAWNNTAAKLFERAYDTFPGFLKNKYYLPEIEELGLGKAISFKPDFSVDPGRSALDSLVNTFTATTMSSSLGAPRLFPVMRNLIQPMYLGSTFLGPGWVSRGYYDLATLLHKGGGLTSPLKAAKLVEETATSMGISMREGGAVPLGFGGEWEAGSALRRASSKMLGPYGFADTANRYTTYQAALHKAEHAISKFGAKNPEKIGKFLQFEGFSKAQAKRWQDLLETGNLDQFKDAYASDMASYINFIYRRWFHPSWQSTSGPIGKLVGQYATFPQGFMPLFKNIFRGPKSLKVKRMATFTLTSIALEEMFRSFGLDMASSLFLSPLHYAGGPTIDIMHSVDAAVNSPIEWERQIGKSKLYYLWKSFIPGFYGAKSMLETFQEEPGTEEWFRRFIGAPRTPPEKIETILGEIGVYE